MQLNGKSDGSREKTFFLLLEISKGSYSYYLSKAEKVNKDNVVTMTTDHLLTGLSCLSAVIFPTYSTAREV